MKAYVASPFKVIIASLCIAFSISNSNLIAQSTIPTSYLPCDAYPICDVSTTNSYLIEMEQSSGSYPYPGAVNECSLDDPHWIAFIAADTSLTVSVEFLTCIGGSGTGQFSIFTGNPKCKLRGVKGLTAIAGDCSCFDDKKSYTFTTVPGKMYYAVIDGCSGSICDAVFTIQQGNISPPQLPDTIQAAPLQLPEFVGNDSICSGAKAIDLCTENLPASVAYVLWALPDGDTIQVTSDSSCITIDSLFRFSQSFQVCVASANNCDTSAFHCRRYYFADPGVKIIHDSICIGYDYTFRDTVLESSTLGVGTYEYEFVTSSPTDDCERPYHLFLEVKEGEFVEASINYTLEDKTLQINNTLENVQAVYWDFGDGTHSTEFNPTHHYEISGTITVSASFYGACDFRYEEFEIFVKPRLSGEILFHPDPPLCIDDSILTLVAKHDTMIYVIWHIPEHSVRPIYGDTITIELDWSGMYAGSVEYEFFDPVTRKIYDRSMVFDPLFTVLPSPIADFTYTLNEGTITVESMYTEDFLPPRYRTSSYIWDFGDGSRGTGVISSNHYMENGTYTITHIRDNACGSDTIQKRIQVKRTATEDAIVKKISLFPNPCTDYLNIQADELQEINVHSYALYDINGNEILPLGKWEGNTSLDISFLKPGIYILKFRGDSRIIYKKFIKAGGW